MNTELAVNTCAYDVSQWLEANGFHELTLDQRELMLRTDAESVADCNGMLDDLGARIGVPEDILMALRWSIHDLRALT
jgi:hypothetical protein